MLIFILQQPNLGDGAYRYDYQTSNGIQVNENGVGGQLSQGQAQWTDPAGIPVGFSWIADGLGGYRAAGTHIPTPPPIPQAILKALDWIRTHPPAPEPQQQFQPQQQQQQFQPQQRQFLPQQQQFQPQRLL